MNKAIAPIIMMLMFALILSGCGGGGAASQPAPAPQSGGSGAPSQAAPESAPSPEPQSPPESAAGGIYKEAGNELNDFYNAFNSSMGAFERAVNDFETDDFDLFDVGSDFIAPTGEIVTICQYDYLESGDNAREEGKNGSFDAVREKSGGIITFSQSMTRESDGFSPNDKQGDVVSESGSLDTSSNTLTMESKVERGGEILVRSVTEVVMLPDGSFIAQTFNKPHQNPKVEYTGTARFVRCTAEELEIIAAHFEPDAGFTYESIAGKAGATPESMAQGYTKIRRLTVSGGKASAEKY